LISICKCCISQTSYLNVIPGGSTNETSWLFRTWYEDHTVKLNYSASEISSISIGDTIFSIGFFVSDRVNRDFEFQVMYNAEIKIIENGITKSVWVGNLAPTEDQWNDIMFDIPYVRSSNNNIVIEFCFNNCEWTSSFYARYRGGAPQFQANSNDGNTYSSTYTICNSTANSDRDRRPDSRFGLSNSVAHQTLNICGNSQVILNASSFSAIPQSFPLFNYYATYTNPQNIESRYYRVQSGRQRSWLEADHHCQSLGGNLAHIQNLAENNVVDNASGTNWIGGFQNCNNSAYSNPSGGWEWSDGNNINYTNWQVGEPNNLGGEQAIEIYDNGRWNDQEIKTENRRYILEVQDKYVWSNGQVTNTPSISINVSTTSTFWVDRIQSGGIKREYFTVIVNQQPSLSLSSQTFTVCPGDSVLISANSASAISYNWSYGQLNPISGVITNQMIQVNDTLTVFVTVADGNNCQTTDSIVINTFQKSDLNIQVVDSICDSSFAYISQIQNNNQYCISRPFDSSFYNVSSVSLIGDNFSINNNTAFINASYSNFTNLIADVTAGLSYTININLQSALGYINFGGKVYVDWNRDGDFYDNGEYISDLSFNNSSLYTITLNVPSFAISGNTRLRIVSQYENNSDLSVISPCDIGSNFSPPYYGETEDYTIFVNSSNSPTNNYVWSNGIIDTIIYNLSPGVYSASYTDQNGCFSIDSVQVGETALIRTLADSNQTICYGGKPNNLTSQSLSLLAPSSIQWQPSNFFINSNISNPQFINGFSLFSDTIFTVTYSNGVCSSVDTVRVEVNQQPIVSNIIINPIPACENDTLTIFAITSSPNITQFKFQKRTLSNNNWINITTNSNGWGNLNPITYGPITETTEFKVKIREESGCRSSEWGAPTNQGIIVPINNMNNLLIYHN
tara:strand:- start:2127 stop:4850 length:2724 start_codon:yes stop_codon:yes gene_type:complete